METKFRFACLLRIKGVHLHLWSVFISLMITRNQKDVSVYYISNYHGVFYYRPSQSATRRPSWRRDFSLRHRSQNLRKISYLCKKSIWKNGSGLVRRHMMRWLCQNGKNPNFRNSGDDLGRKAPFWPYLE